MELYKCNRCGCDTPNSDDIRASDGRLILTYHKCDACKKRFRLEYDFQCQGETLRETELVCPWCGYEYEPYDAYGFDEGDTKAVECRHCGNHFDLEIETRRLFSTKRSLCDMPDDYTGEADE